MNETLITSATQDMTQAQVEVAIQEARINADIWSVLTPEQQAKATKLRAERKAQMEQRRQERRSTVAGKMGGLGCWGWVPGSCEAQLT